MIQGMEEERAESGKDNIHCYLRAFIGENLRRGGAARGRVCAFLHLQVDTPGLFGKSSEYYSEVADMIFHWVCSKPSTGAY